MSEDVTTIEEAQRLIRYLQTELERQRAMNAEMRRAVADLARSFQETLARANDAAETGDIERVKRITFENRQAWQAYLQQIVQAAQTRPEDSRQ
jgi:flagellin-specific chaperone FliS